MANGRQVVLQVERIDGQGSRTATYVLAVHAWRDYEEFQLPISTSSASTELVYFVAQTISFDGTNDPAFATMQNT